IGSVRVKDCQRVAREIIGIQADRIAHRGYRLLEHRGEEAVLTFKISVDHPRIRRRPLRDRCDAGPRESARCKLLGGRVEDLLPGPSSIPSAADGGLRLVHTPYSTE